MGDLDVLLTNDDGVDAVGIRRLYEGLSEVASVTVVAPAADQSAVGRSMSRSVGVAEHDLGYVIDGTPADCIVAGLTALCPDVDVVVAGSNHGANLGSAVLGRSGTVSAAVEATYFDVPAMATSVYIPSEAFEKDVDDLDPAQFDLGVDATRYLLETVVEAGVFDHADYLNINAPITSDGTGEMAVTRPSHVYRMESELDGETIRLVDEIWEMMADGDTPDPPGTDRRAILDGQVSVSPLTAPHSIENHARLDRIVGEFRQE